MKKVFFLVFLFLAVANTPKVNASMQAPEEENVGVVSEATLTSEAINSDIITQIMEEFAHPPKWFKPDESATALNNQTLIDVYNTYLTTVRYHNRHPQDKQTNAQLRVLLSTLCNHAYSFTHQE